MIPVAGYGTRFLPATKAMPKEMLPILDKPLVQYAIEEAAAAGMKDIAFVTGRSKRAIEDHFDINHELDEHLRGTSRESGLVELNRLIQQCTFTYTRQRAALGLGDAIKTGEVLIGDEPFGVILSDDFFVNPTSGAMQQLHRVYQKYRCTVLAVEKVPQSQTQQYGIVKGREIDKGILEIEEIIEKPKPEDSPSNIAVVGRYILQPIVFNELAQVDLGVGGEIQLTDALARVLESQRILAVELKGKRFDCGSMDGFVAATNFMYANRE